MKFRANAGLTVLLLLAAAACDEKTAPSSTTAASATPSGAPVAMPTTMASVTVPATSALAATSGADAAAPSASATATATASTLKPSVTDTMKTSAGDITITPIKHASVLFRFGGKNVYIDPWHEGDFTGLPKADYIFITDVHPDHMDKAAVDGIKQASTIMVGPAAVDKTMKMNVVMNNGETKTVGPMKVEAVPMYNLVRGPQPGKLFHDRGRGNGYVITFGEKRIYVSGDTECTPEMKALKNIDVALVCMNLPYTMPPEEAAQCIKAFRPKMVLPYHYRDSNLDLLEGALKSEPGIEVRKRQWY